MYFKQDFLYLEDNISNDFQVLFVKMNGIEYKMLVLCKNHLLLNSHSMNVKSKINLHSKYLPHLDDEVDHHHYHHH